MYQSFQAHVRTWWDLSFRASSPRSKSTCAERSMSNRMMRTIWPLVLLALFLIVYLPQTGHGFIKDDYRWIATSRVNAPGDLPALFASNVGFYRPLVSATFALDHAIWALDPFGYGITNIALLLGSAVLLYG